MDYITQITVGGTSYNAGILCRNTSAQGGIYRADNFEADQYYNLGVGAVDLQYYSIGATGYQSLAVGESNTASGSFSISLGQRNESTSSYAISIGLYNQVTGEYGASFGCNCDNPFSSIAINSDYYGSNGGYGSGVIKHSGKLSRTLYVEGESDGECLMDLSGLMFNGVIHFQGVYVDGEMFVHTLDATVHIHNNEIVGTKINSYAKDGAFYSSPTSPDLPLSWFSAETPLEIRNRRLYHTYFYGRVEYAQIGLDYTCIADTAGGDYGDIYSEDEYYGGDYY